MVESTWEPSWRHLKKSQNLLKSLALIQEREERSYLNISLHPLVHKWAYIRQTDMSAMSHGYLLDAH
ncbi:hypothetical protein H112_04140 [Trichophyton rubrum D6]|nr:hypothetical protein H100_04145 [Trichophyton rubrum MR850]EZF42198.1 hypothetical protein H102_04133 [Trichophyton rubrum CBS 100081]EZF63447.1 hypothetical protein H104_04130 [Trichophyton rubrum CBS 289.86]EZG06569.1 hypothetical protein H106_03957 [Trichophyton rubrum CBS 735.88]EZG17033.1 hypothetical protein H107_04261 [Trichophyton rubrum CBS 202.88]KDB33950.1 hypothetical protein H112_04140 [Trichophyton rubrum D6]